MQYQRIFERNILKILIAIIIVTSGPHRGLDENKKPIGEVRYWACVKDKWLATETDPNGKTILLKGYEDANKLDQLLALFFTL